MSLAGFGLGPGTDPSLRAKRLNKVVLIGGLIVMGIAGWFVMGHLSTLNKARTGADAFLELVLAGEYDAAEAQMCTDSRPSADDWTALDEYLQAQAGSEPFAFTWYSTQRSDADDPYTRVRYEIAGRESFELEVRMIEIDGDWQPCGIGAVSGANG